MGKFKVGDVITGLDKTPYSITTSQAQMRITEVGLGGGHLMVQILKHSYFERYVGDTFPVDSWYFKLCKPVSLENK